MLRNLLKMSYTCKKLTANDVESAAQLYASAGKFDKYFTEVFNKDSVEQEIYVNYYEDVKNAIVYGDSYGMFHKDKLIGIILAFNIMDWRNNHILEFTRIFNDNTELINSLLEFIKELNTDLLYIFAVCVLDEYRCQGVAKRMIRHLCSKYDTQYTFISDAMHDFAMPMWLSNGFLEIPKGRYKFVIKL